MPNQTPNYNLTKPLKTENYNIDVFNNNADIIDTALKIIDLKVSNMDSTKIKHITREASLEGSQEISYTYVPQKIILIASLKGKMCIGFYDGTTSLSLTDLTTSFTFDSTKPIVFYTSGISDGIYATISRQSDKLVFNWTKFGSDVDGNIEIGIWGI